MTREIVDFDTPDTLATSMIVGARKDRSSGFRTPNGNDFVAVRSTNWPENSPSDRILRVRIVLSAQ